LPTNLSKSHRFMRLDELMLTSKKLGNTAR